MRSLRNFCGLLPAAIRRWCLEKHCELQKAFKIDTKRTEAKPAPEGKILPFGAGFNALAAYGLYQRDQLFFGMRKTIGRIFSVGGRAADGHDLYTGIADHIV